MQSATQQPANNPLSGLISDEVYSVLAEHNLLHDRSVRDYLIRKQFKRLRDQRVPANDAIEMMRERYPYLQFDTIRKIVYGLNGRHFR